MTLSLNERMGKRKWSTVLIVVPACWLGFSLVGCRNNSSKGEASLASGSTSGSSQGGSVTVRRDNPCSVLLPREVEEIVGLPVTMREVVDEETCNFPFDKPAKGGTASSKSTENKRVARSAEGDAEAKAKSIAAGMAGGEPSLVVKVYWENGRQAITATRMAGQLLGGNDAGFEKLSGIGDQAWLGPMASNLTFIKGKTGVELDLRTVPNGREPGIRLAKLIASRL